MKSTLQYTQSPSRGVRVAADDETPVAVGLVPRIAHTAAWERSDHFDPPGFRDYPM